MANDDDPALNNRADHAGDWPQAHQKTPDCCEDTLVFGMRDKHHEFSLGITTVLECLYFAEQAGEVPALGDNWWNAITNRYASLQTLSEIRDASD